MNVIHSIIECLTGSADKAEYPTNEKGRSNTNSSSNNPSKPVRTKEEVATDIVSTFYAAEKLDRALKTKINDLVDEYGWYDNLMAAILSALELALRSGAPMGAAMKEAFNKANEAVQAVEGFAMDHPVLCTVIAIGVLIFIGMPWVIEGLGFVLRTVVGIEELGVVEGSWAALWQARYAGQVPKGSLFSYFQRLGMKWKRGL